MAKHFTIRMNDAGFPIALLCKRWTSLDLTGSGDRNDAVARMPVIAAAPNRRSAQRRARKLSATGDRMVYVIGARAGDDLGELVYADGRRVGADGEPI